MWQFQALNVFLKFKNTIGSDSFIKDFKTSMCPFKRDFESFREDILKAFVKIFVGGVDLTVDVFQDLFLSILKIRFLWNLDNGLQEGNKQLKRIGN